MKIIIAFVNVEDIIMANQIHYKCFRQHFLNFLL